MKAPARSHGFEKPSDLEDELAQLDEERADPELNTASDATPARRGISTSANRSIQRQIDDLRTDLEALRSQVEKLSGKEPHPKHKNEELAAWLPMIRSIAVTSLAGRIFASSPVMALLVAAVPFALGLSAGSK
ncbi:hypothetical protein [Agrobacterium larrymoorei]|uniref:Uncharacterized protein n=1 Tax=Agrobacterium larrymoorei TaxID=160699 RepID=A0AAF0H6Y0_9HYPH|nr:hypothetical protein [Agrobacterium larrymoorei]WHA40876.1 hypothetical protein CFBP5477_013845 [Agrobacterium larrymoorei]